MTRRLTVHFEIAFGKDEVEYEVVEEPEPVVVESSGEVYTNTERRPTEDATEARTIGFGRPSWEDRR